MSHEKNCCLMVGASPSRWLSVKTSYRVFVYGAAHC